MKVGWYYALADDGFGRTVEITATPNKPDKAFWQAVDKAKQRYPNVDIVQCLYAHERIKVLT